MILLCAFLLVAGCVSPTSVVLAPNPNPREAFTLDLRLAYVHIHRQSMMDTLLAIDRAIKRQSGRRHGLAFAVGYGASKNVSIDARDLTVRSLLLEICRQSDLICEMDDPNSPYDVYITYRNPE